MNPTKLKPFRDAYNKKLEERRYFSWLDGMHVQMAISSCFSKSSTYPKEPIGTLHKEIVNGAKPLTDAEKFMMFAMKYNKEKFKESEENNQ